MNSSEPIFDLAQIEENWGGADDDTYRAIIDIFVPEAKNLGAILSQALAGPDRAALLRAAHTLSGASSNVGASNLSSKARDLEFAALDAGQGTLASLNAEVQSALQTVLAVIAAGGPDAHGS
jgi:HPt (histidine-containing phosphotransfer) domain-containing protein